MSNVVNVLTTDITLDTPNTFDTLVIYTIYLTDILDNNILD